jgi:hypothetical protein
VRVRIRAHDSIERPSVYSRVGRKWRMGSSDCEIAPIRFSTVASSSETWISTWSWPSDERNRRHARSPRRFEKAIGCNDWVVSSESAAEAVPASTAAADGSGDESAESAEAEEAVRSVLAAADAVEVVRTDSTRGAAWKTTRRPPVCGGVGTRRYPPFRAAAGTEKAFGSVHGAQR